MQTLAAVFFSRKQLTALLSLLYPSLSLRYTTPSLASSGYCPHTNRENLLPKECGVCTNVKLLVFFFPVASDYLLFLLRVILFGSDSGLLKVKLTWQSADS